MKSNLVYMEQLKEWRAMQQRWSLSNLGLFFWVVFVHSPVDVTRSNSRSLTPLAMTRRVTYLWQSTQAQAVAVCLLVSFLLELNYWYPASTEVLRHTGGDVWVLSQPTLLGIRHSVRYCLLVFLLHTGLTQRVLYDLDCWFLMQQPWAQHAHAWVLC